MAALLEEYAGREHPQAALRSEAVLGPGARAHRRDAQGSAGAGGQREPVARQEIAADGVLRPVAFDYKIDRSSWVALRILPSSHTNPIFVLVGGKPIRASQSERRVVPARGRSMLAAQKESRIRIEERGEATRAYEFARDAYRQRIKESE